MDGKEHLGDSSAYGGAENFEKISDASDKISDASENFEKISDTSEVLVTVGGKC